MFPLEHNNLTFHHIAQINSAQMVEGLKPKIHQKNEFLWLEISRIKEKEPFIFKNNLFLHTWFSNARMYSYTSTFPNLLNIFFLIFAKHNIL